MKIDTISFSVHEVATQHDGQALTCLTPDICINGARLFRSLPAVVDTVDLLVQADARGEFDLLTCTCGVAGCAGFHESVRIEPAADTVTWHVPACGYSGALAAEFGPGPWAFTFNRASYRAALAALEQQLLAAEQRAGIACMSPWEPRDEGEEVPTIAEVLRRARAYFARRQRVQAGFEQAFGDAADQDLCLQFENSPSSEAWMTVQQYAWAALSEQEHPWLPEDDKEFEALAAAHEQAAEALRRDPVSAVRSLPREQLDAYLQFFNRSTGKWTRQSFEEVGDLGGVPFVVRLGRMPD